MKKQPILVQCDKRGQIVIPKNIRLDLGINGNKGFEVYSVTGKGILLKVVNKKK
jgi:AbrB family looped-hinge helix DNA binding protein